MEHANWLMQLKVVFGHTLCGIIWHMPQNWSQFNWTLLSGLSKWHDAIGMRKYHCHYITYSQTDIISHTFNVIRWKSSMRQLWNVGMRNHFFQNNDDRKKIRILMCRSNVCDEAIVKYSGPILFLLICNGPEKVRRPMQFVSLSISVGQMFVMKQFWNVIVRSYFF